MSEEQQGEAGGGGAASVGGTGTAPAVILPARAEREHKKPRPLPGLDSIYERLAAPLPEGTTETLAEREGRRMGHRMPAGYEPQSGADLTFDPRIPYELALDVSTPSEVFAKYGHDIETAKALIALPAFIATVKKYREELSVSGVTFRLKAKIQAEDLLTHSYVLATDPEVPPAVRADLIKWTAKMAGLEPSEKDKGMGGGTGAGFTLNITFAGGAQSPVAVSGRTLEHGEE
jgi:hypothetical protein